ncbi:MAG: hypothetical protein RI907_1621 [Pseudomonadota bacterium]|jgi:hypothetical protein
MIAYDATRDALYHPWKRPTVFRPGVACDGVALAVEAARLAYWPFERDPAQRAALRESLLVAGFDGFTPLVHPATGSQGYGAFRAADGLALLAFRGTEPDDLADIASDLAFSLTAWPGSEARVHHGFADAAHGLLPQVQAWLATLGPKRQRLLVTGHSLGAAIATLVSAVVHPDELVTLGSPRVGDTGFAQLMAQLPMKHTRLVDACDLVTEVPPAIRVPGLLDRPYAHVGLATYIHPDTQATVTPEVDTDSPAVNEERQQARRAYLLEQAWRRGHNLVRDLADHAPINYVRAFFRD